MERAFDVCQFCCFYPASSLDGKPCCMCTASVREVKTNADRIRAMSDDELAEWLDGSSDCTLCCSRKQELSCGPDNICKVHILEWLQQPAKEE